MAKTIGKNSNLKLYKFIPYKYVKKILENAYMPIKRIDGWEDCYENYFLKNKFVKGIENLDLKKVSRKFYGLCFSLYEESDALWRIYSDVKGLNSGKGDGMDNVAIRIRVMPEQLYQLVPVMEKVKGVGYIQKVRYISKEEMESEMDAANPYDMEKIVDITKESFFTKRIEFKHEKEVRYIFVTKNYHKASTINMSLNPYAFFDEFTVDPRLTKPQYCEIKKGLENLNVASSKINQSSLYRFEPKILTIIP